jgi:hypothetical protein
MRARRATFIALRVLALYLLIRGIETALRSASLGFETRPWGELLAPYEPILGAIVLWFAAQPLARRMARARPIDEHEVDAAVADDEEQERDELAGTVSAPMTKAALLVLGVYFVAGGLQALAFDVPSLALHRFTRACAFLGQPAFGGPVPGRCGGFWDPQTVRFAINAGAGLVEGALGAWLVASPLALPDIVKRWWDRRRGPDPMPFDADEHPTG